MKLIIAIDGFIFHLKWSSIIDYPSPHPRSLLMPPIKKSDSTTGLMAMLGHSSIDLGLQSTNRSHSLSPSPVPIRKHRPFQSLNMNQVAQRALVSHDKENSRLVNVDRSRTDVGKLG
ncbi:hypothetical protein O181_034851 [Austropuccinia psidii MF-1]|uniref:Uncharacterized protein n=1 Tax=Austropuccinia psidii MF-1 TaxID=1389203 RepID=A0A9Q3D1K1_9BASI|nr:hypothetical protein [Austropuccinia psidii MF-1]